MQELVGEPARELFEHLFSVLTARQCPHGTRQFFLPQQLGMAAQSANGRHGFASIHPLREAQNAEIDYDFSILHGSLA